MPPQTILNSLRHAAARYGERVALVSSQGQALDYTSLLAAVEGTATKLVAAGCRPGERVAVVLGNDRDAAIAQLAVMSVATCAPLDPSLTARELSVLTEHLGITRFLTGTGHAAALATAEALQLPIVQLTTSARGRLATIEFDRVVVAPEPAKHPAPQVLVLPTSGSTGRPKIVPLTADNLLAATSNVARSLELTSCDVALSALPLFHIGGLVDLLLAPLSVGGAVVFAEDMSPSAFFAQLRTATPTWYQAVPTMLQAILSHAQREGVATRGTSLRFLRSVSAPLSIDVLRACETCFDVPVIEIYGMTETAGVIASNPLPPRQRRPGSVGQAAGCDLAIHDECGRALPPGDKGEVVVRGPSVTAGYEPVAGVADDSLRDGWRRTGDIGYLDEHGYLYLTGRLNEVINRGGEKIAPRELDELASSHPQLRQAASFALPHATLGQEVGLAVVCEDNATVTAAELIAWMSERLAAWKVPRRVWFVDALPMTRTGKLQRFQLSKSLSAAASELRDTAPTSFAPTLDPTQKLLTDLWERALGMRPGLGEDFFDLGGDSLRATEFVRELTERLGCAVPAGALYSHPTIGALAPYVDQVLRETSATRPTPTGLRAEQAMFDELREFVASWHGDRPHGDSLLVARGQPGSRMPFFWCVNGHGEFAIVADLLSPHCVVYGMRSLWETRSKTPANARRLAQRYAEEIQRVQPSGAIQMGGFCSGGAIAFLSAEILRASGREVSLLCLVDHFTARAYDGRVALLYGLSSTHQPIIEPGGRWSRYYRGEVRIHALDADHQTVLTCADFQQALSCEVVGDHLLAPTKTCAADTFLAASLPRLWFGEARRQLTIEIQNRSHRSYSAGTRICSRWWRRAAGTVWLGGDAKLDHDLDPLATVRVSLEITAPAPPGLWSLDIHMQHVEDNAKLKLIPSVMPLQRWVLLVPGRTGWQRFLQRRTRSLFSSPSSGN